MSEEDSTDTSDIPGIPSMPLVVEVDTVKAVQDIPLHAQQVLCLMACGFSEASIARLAKVTPSAICQTITRYDPEKKFTLSRTEKRKFIAALWEARAAEALLHITPEKMMLAEAKDLAGIAAKATKSMSSLDTGSDEEKPDPFAILQGMGRLPSSAGTNA